MIKNIGQRFRRGIWGSLMTVAMVSCSGFLDEDDPSNFTRGNYYTLPEHAESAVVAVYQDLRAVLGGGFNGAPWLMLEFATGLANTSLGQADNSIIVRNLQNTSDNLYGATYWRSHYRGIANANEVITQVPRIEMDEVRKKRLLGEARFLRAYYYYNLVRIFQHVPLISEPVNGLSSPDIYPRAAGVEEIYQLIVDDLKWAEQSGLPFTDRSGRVSLGAVKSLLSGVYLTMAGYPLNKGVSHYTLARDKAFEVIQSNQFRLFDSYLELHRKETKNTGEFIFMAQYHLTDQPSNDVQGLFTPYNRGISRYSAQTGGIYANREFVESYEANDRRAKEKEFYYSTFTLAADRNTVVQLGDYYLYKHFDVDAHLTTAQSELNWPFIRYAEVLLTYAEAANEVSGPEQPAYDAVNQIRKRANVPLLSGLTKEAFRESVWRERWHELSFENKTWFDMVRLRKAFNVSSRKFEDYVGHKFSYGPVLKSRELLFPIPTTEIRNNAQLNQNEGYK